MKSIQLTKKTIGILAAALCCVFLAGAGVARAVDSPDKTTADEALSIALKDAGKDASEVTVTKQRPDAEDGMRTFDIEFFYFEGDSSVTEYDYEIDAATGRVLERSRETEYVTREPKKQVPVQQPQQAPENKPEQKTETAPEQPVQQPQQPAQQQTPVMQPQQPAQQQTPAQSQPVQYIGMEQAKSIALAHAGLGADVLFTKERQDFENGRVVYEIEFYAGLAEYEYEIDAVTGTILDMDMDAD